MNTDTPPPGDEPGDRIPRQWLAAAGDMGQQVAHSAHLHLAAVQPAARPGQLELRAAIFHQPLGGIHHLGR